MSWTFSADLSEQDLSQIQGLIAINGLANGHMDDGGDRAVMGGDDASAAEADAAFERMAAAHPNATIVRGPAGAAPVVDELAAARMAEADAAFDRLAAAYPNATLYSGDDAARATEADTAFELMAAAYPNATVIRGSGGEASSAEDAAARAAETDAAFERMTAAYPNVPIIRGPAGAALSGDDDAASERAAQTDAAFERMAAAYPNATILVPGSVVNSADHVAAHADEADAAFERMSAAHPNATIIRGPGGGAPAPMGGTGSWVFSSDLSPERRAELQGLVAMNGIPSGRAVDAAGGGQTDEEAAAARAAAADAAFAAMVSSYPDAVEIAPGVFGYNPGGEE